MHTHVPDTGHRPDHSDEHPDYLVRIAAAIEDATREHHAAIALPHGSDTENAVRAARLALTAARMGAWWGVLAQAISRDRHAHQLYLRAAVIAEAHEKASARFWQEAAADWTARAQHRPTSDAAGALSNWHELGVTA